MRDIDMNVGAEFVMAADGMTGFRVVFGGCLNGEILKRMLGVVVVGLLALGVPVMAGQGATAFGAGGSVAAKQGATGGGALTTSGTLSTSYTSVLILDPAKKTQLDYWDNAVAKFRADETSAPKGATVLLGDSITAGWPVGLFPESPVVNRGIGGDFIGGWKFPGVGDRLDTSIIALKPKRVFLMIGANDCLDIGPPMETKVAGYALLLDKLKEAAPDAEIYVQSTLPCTRERWEYMLPAIRELNSNIEGLARERGFRFVNLYKHFTGPDGKMKPELTSDGLHLTKEGYELWRKVLIDEGIGKQ